MNFDARDSGAGNFEAGKAARDRRRRRSASFLMIPAFCLLAAFPLWRVEADGNAKTPLAVTSSSFSNLDTIPRQFTCDGEDISPSLEWRAAPAGTRSFALVVHDPDASIDFTHWLAYRIPADVRVLARGASTENAMPRGSEEGVNGFRSVGYDGPCPPPGRAHRYFFEVYALDVNVTLPAGATRAQLEAAMRGHILAEGQIVGVYQREIF
ncbi:MAG: YbhB/YbcL family Raf kinase inhibitor-like protein [Terracidiphilus sp.]